MSASMCADVRELAPELALGIVGGPERAEALQHASECGPCRALVGELAEAADALTLLAPESEPPPGFEERVLAALKAPRRRMRRRAAVMVAAAAAAAAIVSIVGVRVVESVQETNRIVAAASDVRSTRMTGANGVPSGRYGIEFRTGSAAKRLGTVSIRDERGAWGGVVALPNGATGSVVLVGADGAVVCEARLSPAT